MKHHPETLQKYIRRGNAYIAFLSAMNVESIPFCVSYGNQKIGRVLNVSKAPIFTCKGVCSGCKLFCYDIKACLQYTNVMEARMRNTVIFFKDRDLYFDRIRAVMEKRQKNKFLRYDVGGEIVDSDEVSRIVQLAKDFPDFKIWTYTKNHRAVNQYMNENNGYIPGNLVIMFSNINNGEIENPYNFPVFNCVTDDDDGLEIEGAAYCNGDCSACRTNGTGCVAGQTMNVNEH